VKVWAHVSLAELRALDDGSVLAGEWVGEMAVRWAARRAAASQTGSDGAAWLDGKPARAVACDASVIPVVTSGIDPAALDDLVGLCLTYAGHGPHCGSGAGPAGHPDPADPQGQPEDLQPRDPQAGNPQPRDPEPCDPQPVDPTPADLMPGDPPGDDSPCPPGPRPTTAQAEEMLAHAIIGKAADLVSGPGGLASFLRTRLLGARLAGPSLPLDVGHSAQIPAAIRRAVILRDQHCRWARQILPLNTH